MVRNASLFVMILATGLSVACAAAPAAPPADAPADVAAVKALRASFMAAYNKGDADAIGKLYTADAVSASDHQPTITGRDKIVDGLKGMFQEVTIQTNIESEETRTVGDYGFDRGHFTATVTNKADGRRTMNEGRYMVLVAREADGQWRVARDMDNAPAPIIPPSAPAAAPAK